MTRSPAKLDLVVATVGRVTELDRLLASIAAQEGVAVRVLIADQSGDDRLVPLLKSYQGRLETVHIRSVGGVSAARNDGQLQAGDEFIAWPDDDCVYPSGLLARVVDAFAADEGADVLVGRVQDPSGDAAVFPLIQGTRQLDGQSIWRYANANAFFARRSAVRVVGPWNIRLGPGGSTPWDAGEDSEWVVRAVRAELGVQFDASLTVIHPDPFVRSSRTARQRAHRYGRCTTAVALSTGYGRRFVFRLVVRAAAGTVVSFARGRFLEARIHLHSLIGRVEGAVAYARSPETRP